MTWEQAIDAIDELVYRILDLECAAGQLDRGREPALTWYEWKMREVEKMLDQSFDLEEGPGVH